VASPLARAKRWDLDYAVTLPADARPGSHWWALAKVMYFGRVRYTDCAQIQVAG